MILCCSRKRKRTNDQRPMLRAFHAVVVVVVVVVVVMSPPQATTHGLPTMLRRFSSRIVIYKMSNPPVGVVLEHCVRACNASTTTSIRNMSESKVTSSMQSVSSVLEESCTGGSVSAIVAGRTRRNPPRIALQPISFATDHVTDYWLNQKKRL